MEMTVSHSVPIYRRERTSSSNTKRPQLLKPKKKKNQKKAVSNRDSNTSLSDDAIIINSQNARPSKEHAEQEKKDQREQTERQQSVSETASTIDLPLPPPAPPASPDRTSPRFTNRFIPPRPSFTRKSRPKRLRSRASTESLSDSPFTDLVKSINSNTVNGGTTAVSIESPELSPPTSIQHGRGNFHAAEPHPLHGAKSPLRPVLSIAIDSRLSPTAPAAVAVAPQHWSPLTTMMPPAPNQNYVPPPAGTPTTFNPQATYQHIQEMAAKRVSTLDYLRKTHEGRVYWYNTLLFTRPDLSRLPSFSPPRLARRATNFLLLGLSLPAILDINATSPLDYLRALNSLLAEFEAYQQIHPADGTGSTSLSRARIPRFFKTGVTSSGVGKGRRSSSAADIGAPLSIDQSTVMGSGGAVQNGLSTPATSNLGTGAFASNEQELLPGEEYSHLLTPLLPFDPDFFEVFAVLCDVLIDTYAKISALISSPGSVAPGVAEVFAKADARLRKVIVSGVIKEFEEATRAGVKSEIKGINRVVLGGLV